MGASGSSDVRDMDSTARTTIPAHRCTDDAAGQEPRLLVQAGVGVPRRRSSAACERMIIENSVAFAHDTVQQIIPQGCAHSIDVPREQFHISVTTLRGRPCSVRAASFVFFNARHPRRSYFGARSEIASWHDDVSRTPVKGSRLQTGRSARYLPRPRCRRSSEHPPTWRPDGSAGFTRTVSHRATVKAGVRLDALHVLPQAHPPWNRSPSPTRSFHPPR